jgi:hypothetical protein
MPAIRRVIKKAVYAVLFVAIALVPVVFVTVPNILRLRRETPMPTPQAASIIVESIDTVIHDDSADIVARVRNPNPRAGVPEYTVTFVLLDAGGNELQRLHETSYLLPGSLNYIAVLGVPLSSALSKVGVETTDQPRFVALNQSASLPTFNSFLRERSTQRVGTAELEVQRGVVTNTSTLGFRRLDITGVALDTTGKVVGIGKTFVGEFAVGEQREFTIAWPTPATPTERVVILATTNIFRADNILGAQGDPNLLR